VICVEETKNEAADAVDKQQDDKEEEIDDDNEDESLSSHHRSLSTTSQDSGIKSVVSTFCHC